ncbi:MAG: type IV pilus assembly protein PilM [Planctomycetota bacterium]
MAKKNEAWGIDVGANAIKAVKLIRAGGGVQVEDFTVLPFKQILTTPDLDVDQTIQVQLETLIQKHEFDKTRVVVSVPGNMAFARFAKLPPVEPKKIPDIVKFEAQQQIPFPIEQVEWDYQVFQQDDSPDVEVGIFAITKERVMSYLNNYRTVDLKVDSLTLSPLAVYNTFNYESPDGEGAIYMDIGTVSTDVIIVEDGGIWLRTLPIGGNNFTEALVKQFKISFPKAEKLKREAATSKYAKQIFQAMRAVFADLVQEVQRSLGFYQSLNRDSNLTKLVGVGSTFRLPGLQKFLKQQLQIDVIRPDGFEKMPVLDGKRESEFSNHALNMATACGLALQGLDYEKVTANILPSHVLASRMWKAKQPWIAASAACFVAAAGLVGAKHFTDASTIDANLATMETEVRPVLADANRYVEEWSGIQQESDPRQFIKNLRRTLDHRNVWPALLEDISQATLAMQPQAGLLAPDYDQQAGVPRGQRQRVYIESIVPTYQASPPGGAQSGNQRGAGVQGLADMATKQFTAEQFFEGENPPSFTVTLTGTTPLETADSQLNRKLVQWLRDNADRDERPYRFVFEEGTNPIKSLQKVESDLGASRGGAPRSGFGSNAGRFGGATGGYNENFGGNFGGRTGGGNAGRASDIASLIPERPLAEESRATDRRFVISWTVELKSPVDARPKVDDTPSRPTAPGIAPADDEQPVSSPTAAVPDAATDEPLAQAQPRTEATR